MGHGRLIGFQTLFQKLSVPHPCAFLLAQRWETTTPDRNPLVFESNEKARPPKQTSLLFAGEAAKVLPVTATTAATHVTAATATKSAASMAAATKSATAAHMATATAKTSGLATTAKASDLAAAIAIAATVYVARLSACESAAVPVARICTATASETIASASIYLAPSVAATISPSATTTALVPAAIGPAMMTPTVSPTPAVPRPDAEEYPVIKPVRCVVAVWGAGIGIIRVEAPIADRWPVDHGCGNNDGTDSNIIRIFNILGYRRRRQRHSQQSCQQNQLKIPHTILLVPPYPASLGPGPPSTSALPTSGPLAHRPVRLLVSQTAFLRLSCGSLQESLV